ncbi:hypothetical protein [Bradyrhizobium sp. SZCCHNR3118]|uniref:hypothetical protein n=1 Tax=Bradyrhizobium sp. SZCCHNR3118 TaxID=3057468 RepID=UPI0029163F67|nr:hypothetical protein [Bradyrhizobium sp. SZCCHNR3118]
MPRRPVNEESLISIALDALEEEVSRWQTYGFAGHSRRPQERIQLARYPKVNRIDPFGPLPESETIEVHTIEQDKVASFLRYRGMEAAVKAIRRELR